MPCSACWFCHVLPGARASLQIPAAYAREEHENEEMVHDMRCSRPSAGLLFGLVLLVASSRLLVWGASNFARELGVSELIIGLTIIALGTSLPELAASIASLEKGKPDLAVGNVIGSNLFNSLAVVGLPALFTDSASIPRHDCATCPWSSADAGAGDADVRFPGAVPRHLTRGKGIVLFAAFVLYQLYLYYEVAAT